MMVILRSVQGPTKRVPGSFSEGKLPTLGENIKKMRPTDADHHHAVTDHHKEVAAVSLMRWNPLEELDRLRREMDRSFARLWGEESHRREPASASRGWWPAVDLVETENEMILTADLPGIDPKAVRIEVRKESIVLEGRMEESREESDDRYWIQERRMQSFQRTISLPAETDPDKAKASYENGILRVTMPKLEPTPQGRILTLDD